MDAATFSVAVAASDAAAGNDATATLSATIAASDTATATDGVASATIATSDTIRYHHRRIDGTRRAHHLRHCRRGGCGQQTRHRIDRRGRTGMWDYTDTAALRSAYTRAPRQMVLIRAASSPAPASTTDADTATAVDAAVARALQASDSAVGVEDRRWAGAAAERHRHCSRGRCGHHAPTRTAIGDTATAGDAAALSAILAASDTATAVDAGSTSATSAVSGTDAATATDAVAAPGISVSDTATAVDAATVLARTAADVAAGIDARVVSAFPPPTSRRPPSRARRRGRIGRPAHRIGLHQLAHDRRRLACRPDGRRAVIDLGDQLP